MRRSTTTRGSARPRNRAPGGQVEQRALYELRHPERFQEHGPTRKHEGAQVLREHGPRCPRMSRSTRLDAHAFSVAQLGGS